MYCTVHCVYTVLQQAIIVGDFTGQSELHDEKYMYFYLMSIHVPVIETE